jgi:ABC-type branched-subunit amino acid transport system ATPase component
MGILDRLLTRRRRMPHFAALAPRVRRRLNTVCAELSEAEEEMAASLGLTQPPRLLLVDEEEAVVLTPDQRAGTRRQSGAS